MTPPRGIYARTAESKRKQRDTAIKNIMHELKLEVEEATIIYYERKRQSASLGGKKGKGHKFTSASAKKATRKRWGKK